MDLSEPQYWWDRAIMENLHVKASDDYRHISKILRNQANFGNPTKIQEHTVSVDTSREDPSETSRVTTEADLDVFPMSVHDFNLGWPGIRIVNTLKL